MGDPAGARLRPYPLGLHPETLGELISGEQPVHALSPDGRGRQADLGDPRQARRIARPASMRVPGGTRPSGGARVGRWASVGSASMWWWSRKARCELGIASKARSPLGDERTAGRRGEIVQARWEHRDVAPYLRLAVLNYPRRQHYRRLSHAGAAALGSAITALLGLVAASAGVAPSRDSWS
jgi:hypothetical protein